MVNLFNQSYFAESYLLFCFFEYIDIMKDFENLLKQNIYYQFLFGDYSLGLTPLIIGFEKCDGAKPQIAYKKPHFVLHFVLKGSGRYTIRNTTYNLHEKMIFIIPAEEKVSYKPIASDPWEYVWIEFAGLASKPLLAEAGFSVEKPLIRPQNFDIIEECLYRIMQESLTRKGHKNLLTAVELLAILDILANERNEKEENKKPKHERRGIEEVLRYIDRNYAKSDISISDLAHSLYFNPTYLTKVFKKEMGVSLMQYVVECRMKKACEMLSTHQYSICEIATNVGYTNQFYFSKVFKEFYKVSPSRYQPVSSDK